MVFGSRCRPRRGSEPRVGFRDYKNYFGSICVAASVRPGSGRVHEHTTLGSRPAPGTPSAKRSVGTRRAASMQDTLSEGTARAAQLAPSAVTTSAVGGSATRSVVADSLRRRAGARSREEHARSLARRRGCFLGCVSCKFSHFRQKRISGFLKNKRKREKRRW